MYNRKQEQPLRVSIAIYVFLVDVRKEFYSHYIFSVIELAADLCIVPDVKRMTSNTINREIIELRLRGNTINTLVT